MDYKKLQSIKFALMEKEKDIKDSEKVDFIIYASATFKFLPDFSQDLSRGILSELIESIYADLIKDKEIAKEDSLGLWIDYDDNKYENSITLDTLNLIKTHGAKDIEPIYEFFKMTLAE